MKPAEVLRSLRRIRREAQAVLAGRPAPALAQTMHTVERACHLAAWQIGEAASLLPEDTGERRPARATAAGRRGRSGPTRARGASRDAGRARPAGRS